jgi:hypothetical protein
VFGVLAYFHEDAFKSEEVSNVSFVNSDYCLEFLVILMEMP